MRFPLLALVFVAGLLSGCAQYENKRGVEVTWQESTLSQLETGRSTRQDVIALLGPPSQIVALDGESALYYLFEHSVGDGLLLILYNRTRIETRYDRAVFFFDANDRLTEYATHIDDSAPR